MITRFVTVAIAVTVSSLTPFSAAQTPAARSGQLSSPITWINAEGKSGVVHMAQKTRDGRLILTPNESFFPKLGLIAAGTGIVPDIGNLNKGQSFGYITAWDQGDQVDWGVWLEQPGSIDVEIRMSGASRRDRFTLTFANGDPQSFQASTSAKLRLETDQKGLQTLRLEKISLGASQTKIHWIQVSGPAIHNGAVIRKRWRPAAAHTRFSSSLQEGGIRLWVMEMDATPGALGFYSPITTPFGYYGPSWNADGTVKTSFNFSLWSYGRGKQEPPIEQLSHLLAIGNPNARFSGFGHEGTGVKIRDWEPLAGRQSQRQAIALRVEPGPVYDTYHSYFYARDEKRWRLFGIGNKYNNGKPLKSLWVGSFVEVPGPPQQQRTGPYIREMRYRGWVRNTDGQWSALDRMSVGDVDRETGYTYTDRGVNQEGWFFQQTGGWEFRKPPSGKYVENKNALAAPLPDYLKPAAIKPLLETPSEIRGTQITRDGSNASVTFTIRNLGPDAEVHVYWGAKEGLTFVKQWTHEAKVGTPVEGLNQFVIRNASRNKPLFVRLLLRNAEGQYWTAETLSLNAH